MMRNLLLIIFSCCSVLPVWGQRTAVDSVKLTCTGATGTAGSFNAIALADAGRFWTVYVKDKVGGILSHGWNGNLRIEKRDTANLQVTDSLTFTGTAALMEAETDDMGNLYVLLYIHDTLRVDNNTLISKAQSHMLAKITPAMQVEWVNSDIEGDNFGVSPDGKRLYLRADHNGGSQTVDMYKLDATGNVVQTKPINKIGYIADVATNAAGDVFFTGSCSSQGAQLDTVDASCSFTYSLYLAKLDSNMVCVWIKILQDFTCPPPWLETDDNGNVLWYSNLNKANTLGQYNMDVSQQEFLFASAGTSGSVNFAIDVPGKGHKVLPAKYDAKGMATHGNLAAVAVLHHGMKDTIDWNNNVQTESDIWGGKPVILETDLTTGQVVDATYLDYNAGYFYGSLLYLNNGDLLVVNTSNTDKYIQITRLRKPGTTHITPGEKDSFTLYPNPTSGVVRFSKPLTGSIYSITGIRVMDVNNTRTADLGGEPDGIYYLRTTEGVVKILKH